MKPPLKLPIILLAIVLTSAVSVAHARKLAPPEEYGRVVINNHSMRAGLSPVVFDHWLHRSMFTCRLCHVDIGFAMDEGETDITAEANRKGFYCGACHNGERTIGKIKVFASCSEKRPSGVEGALCLRCHSQGQKIKKEYIFSEFTRNFPRDPAGGGIDWDKAESEGKIKPIDVLEGVSIKRKPLPLPKDFSMDSRGTWMSDITFSHKKHSAWAGCELCHPELFEIKKGATKFTMIQIDSGEYCGVCHGKVAFSTFDCRRCHTKPVK